MSAQDLAALITALGLGTVLPQLAQQVVKHWTGRSARERAESTGILRDRAEALADRDAADERRRAAQEETAHYRRALIELGVDPDKYR